MITRRQILSWLGIALPSSLISFPFIDNILKADERHKPFGNIQSIKVATTTNIDNNWINYYENQKTFNSIGPGIKLEVDIDVFYPKHTFHFKMFNPEDLTSLRTMDFFWEIDEYISSKFVNVGPIMKSLDFGIGINHKFFPIVKARPKCSSITT